VSIAHVKLTPPRYGARGFSFIRDRDVWAREIDDFVFIRILGWDFSFTIRREVDA